LGDPAGLPAGTITIAGLLQKNGYETAISGKWHLGAVPEARPMNYGFTSSYGYFLGQIDPYTHLYKTGVKTWHRNDELIEEEGHATDLITKEALRIIKKDRNSPFFLYVAYSVPHYPLDEPEKWINIYKNTIKNESRRLFAASMSHMDYCIGLILDALREKSIERNTIIMFLSDNGGQQNWKPVNEYNLKFAGNDVLGDNRPLRDWKGSLYNGALRVPAILAWPGKLKHTKISEALNVADIYPTMAYIAKIDVPEELNIEGINFWPVLEGNKMRKDRIMYWKSPNAIAVKKGDWKLIHHGKRPEKGEEEVFNLRVDPFETNSLAGSDQNKVIELRKELKYHILQDSIWSTKVPK